MSRRPVRNEIGEIFFYRLTIYISIADELKSKLTSITAELEATGATPHLLTVPRYLHCPGLTNQGAPLTSASESPLRSAAPNSGKKKRYKVN